MTSPKRLVALFVFLAALTGSVVLQAGVATAATTAWAPAAQVRGTDVRVTVTGAAPMGATGYNFTLNNVRVASNATQATSPNAALVAGTYTYLVQPVNNTALVGSAKRVSITVAPPAAPALTATATGTSVVLAITSPVPASYLVYRDGSLVSETPSSTVMLASQPAGLHSYTVRAVTASGASPLSAPAMANILLPPASLSVEYRFPDVIVTAAPVPGAAAYRFTREGSPAGTGLDGTVTVTSASNKFIDSTRATKAGIYTYTVWPVSPSGAAGVASSVTVPVAVPATPAVQATASGSEVTFTVSGSTATEWWVYRNGALVTKVAGAPASFKVTNQPVGLWSWTVRAVGPTGMSDPSAYRLLTSTLPAPSNLAVQRTGNDLTLTFTAVPGAVRYVISRNGIPFSNTTTTSWVETGAGLVTAPVTYSVQTLDSRGNLGPAASVTWTPPPAPY